MMYAVLCVYVFVFMFNEYVWFVCALLCDVVWPVLLCFLCVVCLCVAVCVYVFGSFVCAILCGCCVMCCF